jgi:HEXXH motif-containing protein
VPWWATLRDATAKRVVLFASGNLQGMTSPLVPSTMFVNCALVTTELAERLVHEATHGQVYDLQDAVRLTTAPPEHRISSPLRADPRPVQGVFHATVVSARVHIAMRASSAADGPWSEAVAASAKRAAEATRRGCGELLDAGRLTAEGREYVLAAHAAVGE